MLDLQDIIVYSFEMVLIFSFYVIVSWNLFYNLFNESYLTNKTVLKAANFRKFHSTKFFFLVDKNFVY